MINAKGQTTQTALVLAPTSADAEVAVSVLKSAGLHALACTDMMDLAERVSDNCGCIILAEESIQTADIGALQEILTRQESWSDLPLILLTSGGVERAAELFSRSGNVAILERPFSQITLIKAVEVALRARNRQFEVRNLLEEQKQQSLRRDEFFATLSHELRTPLSVILGWVELLRDGKVETAAQRAEAFEILDRNARAQQSLIDDLLDVSRIISGKLVFEFAPLSLTQLVKSVGQAFVPRAKEKNITIDVEVPNEALPVMADEQRLTQLISNLVTNAIKFTLGGGRISLKLTKHNSHVLLEVSDNGLGIEPAFLPYIFERLKQEDSSTTRNHGGMGLGLSIASHIAHEHKGSLQAFSEGKGRGAKFVLRIALLDSAVSAKPHAAKKDDQFISLKNIRVLVVDDSPDILQLINLWLAKAGAEVQLVKSSRDALEAVRSFKPHVFLSDIGMPEMDGYQLISQIRKLARSEGGSVPAIALTAYARDAERELAIKAGFQRHISKPISSRELILAISELSASGDRLRERSHD